jgi:hypothetical protein
MNSGDGVRMSRHYARGMKAAGGLTLTCRTLECREVGCWPASVTPSSGCAANRRAVMLWGTSTRAIWPYMATGTMVEVDHACDPHKQITAPVP